jgi:hypothetical protein
MKQRNGFVSNSSSSSFCIFGGVVDNDEKELPKGSSLDYVYGISNYADSILVGCAPQDMGEDETRGRFEERITKEIHKIFGNNIACSWYTDGGYNG